MMSVRVHHHEGAAVSGARQLNLLIADADLTWAPATLVDTNELLGRTHYLGPIRSGGQLILGGWLDRVLVAAMVWRRPTARHLPQDGSWLELSRWCLTPEAGPNAGSRMHRYAVRTIRERYREVTTLVSYSDPAHGHSGSLYRACNWYWAPAWHRLRPPPTGGGDWNGRGLQQPKDRWIFDLRRDERRAALLNPDDPPAVRRYLASEEWATTTHRWRSSLEDLL